MDFPNGKISNVKGNIAVPPQDLEIILYGHAIKSLFINMKILDCEMVYIPANMTKEAISLRQD